VAECISRHNQHPPVGIIFARPYITRLVRGLGAMGRIRSMERVGGSTVVRIKTLLAIDLVRHHGSNYVVVHPDAQPTDSEDESSSSGTPQGERSFFLTELHHKLQEIRTTQQRHGEDLTKLIQGQQDLLRGQQDLLALLQPPYSTGTSAPPASTDNWDAWD